MNDDYLNDYPFEVLIVDDDAGIREELAVLLKENNLKVDTAADGKEGLEKLRARRYDIDVAIVDLKMPEMNGLEMIQHAHDEGVNAFMIILTGKGDKDDAIAALRLQYLVKDWFDKQTLNDEQFVKRVRNIAEGIPDEVLSRIMAKLSPDIAA